MQNEGKKKILNSAGECIILDRLFTSVDGVVEYLEGTGLADIFRERRINDLVDYVFGIETGLDSNARKYILQNGQSFKELLVMMKNDLILSSRLMLKRIL